VLADDQIRRYARHVLLREIGGRGQQRLLAGSVRVEGLGRAADEAARYLAAAGVGTLVLAPELAAAIASHVAAANPDVRVVALDPDAGDPDADESERIRVVPSDPGSRLAGAKAALGAIVVLSGARLEHPWMEAPCPA